MTETTMLQFAAQSYQSRSLPLDAQRLVNMFVERSPKDAKDQVPIFMCPGLKAFAWPPNGPCYGMYLFQDHLYAVCGGNLYTIDEYGGVTKPLYTETYDADGNVIGVNTNLGGPTIEFADNGYQLLMTDCQVGWIYQPGGLWSHTTETQTAGVNDIQILAVGSFTGADAINMQLDNGDVFVFEPDYIYYNGTEYHDLDSLPDVNGQVIVLVSNSTLIPSTITAGANVWWTENVLAQIKDPAFYPPNALCYFDGYFVWSRKGTNEFFLSALNDGTQYSALDYASAQASSGLILALVNYHEQLLVMKEKTIEFWYDSGAANFPFARYDGAYVQRGIAGQNAFCQEDNTVFWLGEDLIYYRLNGFQPQRISTFATEHAWAQYEVTADAVNYVVTIEGHKFIFLWFPFANAMWCYDISSGTEEPLWHERASMGVAFVTKLFALASGGGYDDPHPVQANIEGYQAQAQPGLMGAFRCSCAINAYGKVLFGDRFAGVIGEADFSTFSEYGNLMQAIVAAPPMSAKRKRLFLQRFELDIESGVGLQYSTDAFSLLPLAGGIGTDPKWFLDWSKDGGKTFSTIQQARSMGAVGEYTTRLRWIKLGVARQWTLRLISTDPVRRVIIGTYVQAYEGMD